jgi:hypothetical protein
MGRVRAGRRSRRHGDRCQAGDIVDEPTFGLGGDRERIELESAIPLVVEPAMAKPSSPAVGLAVKASIAVLPEAQASPAAVPAARAVATVPQATQVRRREVEDGNYMERHEWHLRRGR